MSKESKSDVIDVLLRIMHTANMVALRRGTDFEDLAKAYENAVMKELADITTDASAPPQEAQE